MFRILVSSILVLLFLASAAQQNLDFENGLSGWRVLGKNISLDSVNAYSGRRCLHMGPGFAEISQRMRVSPLNLIQFHFFLRSPHQPVSGYAFIRFFNDQNELQLEYRSNYLANENYQPVGYYTESPPASGSVWIGIEKDSSSTDELYADGVDFDPQAGEAHGAHMPACDLDVYLRPFWRGDTIFDEAVLLYAEEGKAAQGRLLFEPDHIISVKSFDGTRKYESEKDFSVVGRTLIRAGGSSMPFRADTSFDRRNDLAWYALQSQWCLVSYSHKGRWEGPVPQFMANHLPNTLKKLSTGLPLNIAAYGMSITRGMNVSGYDDTLPYMPSYVALFGRSLENLFQHKKISLYNAALPGADAAWGAKYIRQYLIPLHPDLVILDFGMNDFWRYTPAQFLDFIHSMIGQVRSANQETEFILISNLGFDPAYILETDSNRKFYFANMEGYAKLLRTFQGPGIINLDMYSISLEIYRLKKAKDCLANPLHPNDYMARWYAQAMTALFQNKIGDMHARE